jgi:BolA-like protein 3
MFGLHRVSRSVSRQFCSSTSAEDRIRTLLTSALKPTKLVVEDTSGGCGAMYSIKVESEMFQGKTLVMQHKMVKGAIAEEIKDIHGLTVSTKVVKA